MSILTPKRGSMTLEAITVFLLYFFMIISILTLVNVVTLQARIQYALTQTAITVSMYAYLLHVTGLDTRLIQIAEDNDSFEANIHGVAGQANTVLNDVSNLMDMVSNLNISGLASDGRQSFNNVGNLMGSADEFISGMVSNPQEAFQVLMRYGLGEITDATFANFVVRPLFAHYLTNGLDDGATFLRNFGVIDGLAGVSFYDFSFAGIEFDNQENQFIDVRGRNTTLLTSDGDVRIAVRYEIYYSFGALPLPFEPRLRVSQVVQTRAWLGGRGERFIP